MGNGILAGHMREVTKPFNIFPYEFSFFLDYREELVYSYFNVILIELREELSFKVNPRINRATW